jgi:hypothetical protein
MGNFELSLKKRPEAGNLLEECSLLLNAADGPIL